MIRTEKLTKKFSEERGVFSLDLNVPKGMIYGFVGHNGAGKTTTIKMLCGLLKADSGKAFINGLEITPSNIAKIKRSIGYMPDITGVYPQMSVWEFLDFYGASFKIPPRQRKKRIDEVLEITHSAEMLDFQVASLSRGMRQRIGLAKTLIHDPEVLILDEPAGGLDPNARIEMRQTISRLRETGKTILLSSHILPELSSVCDLVGIIFKGRLLAQGTVDEISSQLKEHLSIEITVDSDMDKLMEILKRMDAVKGLKKADENQARIMFNGTRDDVSSLLYTLMKHDLPVRWFREVEADLENVFMDIVTKEEA
jgi:ABC-2 type transport system ATP-binding protein